MKKKLKTINETKANDAKKCNGAWVHMQISGKQLKRLRFLEAASGVPIPEILLGLKS